MNYRNFLVLAENRKASRRGYSPTPHSDIEITRPYDDASTTKIYHKPSGVYYTIGHHGKYHNVAWDHSSGAPGSLTDKQRFRIARNAEHVWKNHVEPGFSPGHIVSNEPIQNNGKSAREKGYERVGFSPANKHGMQFAKVGNTYSGGRTGRFTPYTPNKIQRAVLRTNREMKASGGLRSDIQQNFNSPTTGNPLLDRNRRRLPGSTGPAGVRLAD